MNSPQNGELCRQFFTHRSLIHSCLLFVFTLYLFIFSLSANASGFDVTKSSRNQAGALVQEGYVMGADNNKLFVRVVGEAKQSIIFLHGGPGFDIHDGGLELDPLGKDYRIIAFDQRGGGNSQEVKDTALFTPKHLVADIKALKNHFGLDTFTLMGQSWGSGLAMLYADAHPQDIDRMILMAPMPIRQDMLAYRLTQVKKLKTKKEDETLTKLRNADLSNATEAEVIANCRAYIPLIFKPYTSKFTDWSIMTGDFCSSDLGGIKRRWHLWGTIIGHIKGYDWREMASNYTGPTYVLDGELSMVPLNTTTEWAAYLPNSRVELTKDAGHIIFIDAQQALYRAVGEFMQGRWPQNAYPLDLADLDLLASYEFSGKIENVADNHVNFTGEGKFSYAADRYGNKQAAISLAKGSALRVVEPKWEVPLQHFSWSGWFKLDNKHTTNLMTQGDNMTLSWQADHLNFRVADLTVQARHSLKGDKSKWLHVGVVKQKNNVRLYINGQLAGAGQGKDLPLQSGDFVITNQSTGSNGLIDDVRIYAGSLTDTQMQVVFHHMN